MNPPLDKILEGINQKDISAYRYLYQNYYASLCSYASQFLGEVKEEEDVVQDIFMKVWERKGEFTDMHSLIGYLYRAVHNACLLKVRDHREVLGKDLEIAEANLVYDTADQERLLIKEEYYRQIYVIIQSLSPQRKAIIMLSLQGKKTEEIAQELGISVNTIKTLKKKIYTSLRQELSREVWMFFCFLHLFHRM